MTKFPLIDPMKGRIDRLVAGDLRDADRASLLAWLDEDPRRWRACGVAFLEAQSWEAALTDWPSPLVRIASEGKSRSMPTEPAVPCPPRLISRRLLALAASIVLAFTAGAVLTRWFTLGPSVAAPPAAPVRSPTAASPPPAQPLLATVAVRTNLDPQLFAQIQVPVTTADRVRHDAPAISDYDRKQWEKRGFEVTEERRYLPARLPDGREVVVPVSKVNLKIKRTPLS